MLPAAISRRQIFRNAADRWRFDIFRDTLIENSFRQADASLIAFAGQLR